MSPIASDSVSSRGSGDALAKEASAAFGAVLKEWRGIRRFSQLQLSLEADISSRHVSFLESGRARPSRAMVMRLAGVLQMPKAATNQALNAAGFAPAYQKLPMDDTSLEPIRSAVSHMLSNHHPFPAIAINSDWDLVEVNECAANLFVALGVTGATNMIDALIAAGESDLIDNWEEAAFLALERLRTEIAMEGRNRVLERYASQLAQHPRLHAFDTDAVDFTQAVIPTRFKFGDNCLSLFTTVAQFGGVQDLALSDIRVEMMFPGDEETRVYFETYAP